MNVSTEGCTLYISNKLTSIWECAFGSSCFTIYCEAESRPSTWDVGWLGNNIDKPTVNWVSNSKKQITSLIIHINYVLNEVF